jgi:hypothetical protein
MGKSAKAESSVLPTEKATNKTAAMLSLLQKISKS